MKTSYFSFALLMTFSVTFSQNKATPFESQETTISLTLFDTNTTEADQINSLQTLGKTVWSNSFDTAKINLFPKEFNWYTDSKRIKSIKEMISTVQRQDICGRDLPTIDIHSEVIQNVYFKSLYNR